MDRQTLRQDDSIYPLNTNKDMKSNRWTDRHSDKMILIYPKYKKKQRYEEKQMDRQTLDKMILIYPLNTNKRCKEHDDDRWTDRHSDKMILIYPKYKQRHEEARWTDRHRRQDDSYIPSKYKQRHEEQDEEDLDGPQIQEKTNEPKTCNRLDSDKMILIYPLNTTKDMKSVNRHCDRHSDKMILIYHSKYKNKDMKSNRWTDRH
ncbi:unnamed protein product [Mytilus edulis]|uniref:Uncharacterized protein n=1 Tax=Mytilus edulis TaxID=6550 RepID=A0A8S3TUB7_MYTED|nr:unnamed protein product [Mytilus edulis]